MKGTVEVMEKKFMMNVKKTSNKFQSDSRNVEFYGFFIQKIVNFKLSPTSVFLPPNGLWNIHRE